MSNIFARLSLLFHFITLHYLYYSTKKRILLLGLLFLFGARFFYEQLSSYPYLSILITFFTFCMIGLGSIFSFVLVKLENKTINKYTTFSRFSQKLCMSPYLDLKTLREQKNVLKILTNGFIEALELLPEVFPKGKNITIYTHESVLRKIERKYKTNPFLNIQYEPLKRMKIVKEKLLLCSSWKQIFSDRHDGRHLLKKSTHYKITVRIEPIPNLKGA